MYVFTRALYRESNTLSLMERPVCVFVYSGKRKSGKDYLGDLIQKRLGLDTCCILRLSGPLKAQYAKENGLDYNQLLTSSSYKETFRARMITWGEERRAKEPDYFCKLATSGSDAGKPVWIISDARRTTDIQYFVETYKDATCLVRIMADDDVRAERGYVFTDGIDDAVSECGLDHVRNWDFVIDNSGDMESLNNALDTMVDRAQTRLREWGTCCT